MYTSIVDPFFGRGYCEAASQSHHRSRPHDVGPIEGIQQVATDTTMYYYE